MSHEIIAVKGMQVFTMRNHPGVLAAVYTADGHSGKAICTAGISIGTHEVKFKYDGGDKWYGLGCTNAARAIEEIIEPLLIGMDATDQYAIDHAMLNMPIELKEKTGGNAIAAVSAAALKAGAASAGMPLYKHMGGEGAIYLPVPGVPAFMGSDRYGGGVTTPDPKPTYSFMCHGFSSFSEASYAGWEIQEEWKRTMKGMGIFPPDQCAFFYIPAGRYGSDEELWELMANTIVKTGYDGRVGIQVDCASDTYYDRKKKVYRGLFDAREKTRDEMMDLYINAVKNYPFVILEDPFNEDDYESHAELIKNIDIQVVGDDLFTTNPERVEYGAHVGACNTVLLKVNQVGTISQTLEMVQLAYKYGYGVMPCDSRGEAEAIADYCVGINAGSVREMAVGMIANRFLEIEKELGSKARFAGTEGLKGRRFAANKNL